MTDVVSLELLLDQQTEAAVRAEWAALAGAGLSSLGAHPSPSNRPHITLLVRPGVRSLATAELARSLRLPVPLALGAPILFGAGDRRVLARSVTASPALFELHTALHRLAGPGDDAPHTRPGDWTPHVTLARRLRLETIPQALRLLDGLHDELGEDAAPSATGAAAVALRRWDSATATTTSLLDAD